MSSKEYLKKAYMMEKKIKFETLKLETARSALHGRAITYGPVGRKSVTYGNGTENSIVHIIDIEERINSEKEQLAAVRSDIENRINTIDNDDLREVLIRRYLMYQKWEVIAEEMLFSVRYVYKLHVRALALFPTEELLPLQKLAS